VLECTCTPIRLLGVGRGWCLGTTVDSVFKIILGRRDERINNTGTSLSAGQAGGGLGLDRAARLVYSIHFHSVRLYCERGVGLGLDRPARSWHHPETDVSLPSAIRLGGV